MVDKGRSLCKCLSSYGICRRFIEISEEISEDGWEVVLHSLMLGPSVPQPGPGGTIPWGGYPAGGRDHIYIYLFTT